LNSKRKTVKTSPKTWKTKKAPP